MRLMRLWHTLRWLRPAQIWGRLWFRIYHPRPDLREAPPLRPVQGKWRPCARAGAMSGPASFRFLNVERTVQSAGDWNRADWPKLWLYNLHYFDDLTAVGASGRVAWHRSLVERWILENPPAKGNGWEPYPTSLRLVNWIKWGFSGNPLGEGVCRSLAVQTRWLGRRLEVYLLGNHLWANAKALVFAGTCFEGAEANRWRERGLRLLRRELGEQILADGGHCERSPMYHAIVLEDVLDVLQLSALFPGMLRQEDVARWRGTAQRMLRWLRIMTQPDGGIAFFNDAALGIAPSCAALIDYARNLGLEIPEEPLAAIEPLPQSGYVRMEAGQAVLIADVGEIGPGYLTGHAHADTLSFELSLRGRRVLVNGGTSTYNTGVERVHQRGSKMHNTVQVNGEDSSEVWGSFRVARRAKPHGVGWAKEGDELHLHASHDGYARLKAVGRVDRTWRLGEDRLQVIDRVEGKPEGAVAAVARYRSHPSFAFDVETERTGLLCGEGLSLRWKAVDAAAVRVVPGSWHPRFGVTAPCRVLEIELSGTRLCTEFSWA